MKLLWEERAWADYLYWQGQDRKTLKRINDLLKDVQRNAFEGIGKPEPLRENLSGCWSRRIDDTNRPRLSHTGRQFVHTRMQRTLLSIGKAGNMPYTAYA